MWIDKLAHLIAFTLFLFVWYAAIQFHSLAFYLGNPIEVFEVLYANTINGVLPYHAAITGIESLFGLIIGTFLGALFGLFAWYSPLFYRLTRPYVFVLSVIPIFAFAPLVIVWFGIGMSMKIALASLASFLVSFTEATNAAQLVPHQDIQRLMLMKATRIQILRILVFPSCLLRILQSARTNVGVALLGAFVGEFISSNQGIASEMIRAGALYRVSYVLAASCYLLLLGMILLAGVLFIENRKNVIISCISVSAKNKSF